MDLDYALDEDERILDLRMDVEGWQRECALKDARIAELEETVRSLTREGR